MTRNDIIRMAREAGFEHIAEAEHWHPYFERFHAIAVAEEREACALVCERLPETFKIVADEFGYKAETPTAENYAAAIRTRSDT